MRISYSTGSAAVQCCILSCCSAGAASALAPQSELPLVAFWANRCSALPGCSAKCGNSMPSCRRNSLPQMPVLIAPAPSKFTGYATLLKLHGCRQNPHDTPRFWCSGFLVTINANLTRLGGARENSGNCSNPAGQMDASTSEWNKANSIGDNTIDN